MGKVCNVFLKKEISKMTTASMSLPEPHLQMWCGGTEGGVLAKLGGYVLSEAIRRRNLEADDSWGQTMVAEI